MLNKIMKKFIQLESASGIILFFALILALILKNSPLSLGYQWLLHTPVPFTLEHFEFSKPLVWWIDEVLMTFFFLLISLEIKREALVGNLQGIKKISLPLIGALGGIILPAIIYVIFNFHSPPTLRGWAIPTATDVALSLAVITLLGKRIPHNLKLFLIALAIFDDVAAIAIIAFFYTSNLSWLGSMLALLSIIILFIINYFNITRLSIYFLVGTLLWLALLNSGIHATLAGVVLALAIPLGNSKYSPLESLEKKLHPWVAYFILPLFVLTNGGFELNFKMSQFTHPVFLGISLGLLVGKSFGIFGICWLSTRLKLTALPAHVNLYQLFGISVIAGIGFTMSLFVTILAFHNTAYEEIARQGVIIGSLMAGIIGASLFMLMNNHTQQNP